MLFVRNLPILVLPKSIFIVCGRDCCGSILTNGEKQCLRVMSESIRYEIFHFPAKIYSIVRGTEWQVEIIRLRYSLEQGSLRLGGACSTAVVAPFKDISISKQRMALVDGWEKDTLIELGASVVTSIVLKCFPEEVTVCTSVYLLLLYCPQSSWKKVR